jgi:microcystin-dependent protein
MQLSTRPTKVSIAWASSAGSGYKRTIPTTSQIGINDGQASFPDGFVPKNTSDSGTAAVAPSIKDFNGILNAITAIQQWQCGGGLFPFDSAWAATTGGYAKGAVVVKSTGIGFWISLTDNNTTNPDTAYSANWCDLEQLYYAADVSASANSCTVTYPIPIAFLTDGMTFRFKVAVTNNGPATLNINGLGAKNIYTLQHKLLSGYELSSGGIAEVAWNSSINSGNGGFVLLSAGGGAQSYAAGEVRFFALTSAPLGFVKCNGTLLNRVTYGALFSAIGTTFGAGDGSTTFALPDYRGEFIRCLDDGRGIDSGRTLSVWQNQDIQPHSHRIPQGSSFGSGNSWQGNTNYIGNNYYSDSAGGTETRPRNFPLLACMKY